MIIKKQKKVKGDGAYLHNTKFFKSYSFYIFYFILFIYKLKKYYFINKPFETHIFKVYQKTKVNIQRYSIPNNKKYKKNIKSTIINIKKVQL